MTVGSTAGRTTATLASGIADSGRLRERTLRATFWATADQVLTQLVQVLLYVVMAHLLGPHAFGVMAMALVVSGFATLIGQLGVDVALVQARELDDGTVAAVFWVALGVNVLLGAGLAVGAPVVSGFYRQPELTPVVMLVSLILPLGALATVPRALLTRRLEFTPIFVADALALAAGAAVTIGLALAGAGVLSLATGLVTQTAVQSVALLLRCRWRPASRPNLHRARALSTYSANLLGFNVVNYWARNVDNLLVGRVLGALALGLYERAYLLMLYPVTQVMATLGRVMVSTMSRMGDDLDRVRAAYVRSVGALAVVTAPLMFGLAAVTEPFVATVFGARWLPMAGVLRILALVGALQAVVSPVGFIYQSQGRTRLMLVTGAGNALVIVAAIVIGVRLGSITSVAACYAGAVAVIAYPTVAIPARLIGLRCRDIAYACAGSFGAAAVMAGVVSATDAGLRPIATPAARLAVGLVVGAVSYVAALGVLRVSAARDLVRLIAPYCSKTFRRFAPSAAASR